MINLPFIKKQRKTSPVILLVLDGFGIAPPSNGNAISLAKTPNIDYFLKHYPNTQLIASGESVGLPANEVGNTEVGHLTMGAGRVILQDLKRINQAIQKGTFFDNRALLKLALHVKNNNSKIHIMGLIGSGNVHSSVDHLYAVLEFCKRENLKNVYLHLFTDGRDSPQREGIEIIQRIENHLKAIQFGQIASVSGRYYAMDRDRRWDRTEKAYKAIVLGRGKTASSASEAMRNTYNMNLTDEFVEPTVIVNSGKPAAVVSNNDGVFFYNFRIDRPRQLTMAFVIEDFEKLKKFDFGYDPGLSKELGELEVGKTFEREVVPKNVYFVTMTEYQKSLPVSDIAFGPESVERPFAEIIDENGVRHMHMSESEKERFVTYYFNGVREKPFKLESDIIIASPKVSTYDKKPEMSLPKLASELKKQISKDIYGFFVVNFANPDMVAHTGNLQASIKAIEEVDKYVGEVVKRALEVGGTVFLTADHGNAEELITYPTSSYFYTSQKGTVNTDHSNNPVPLIFINKDYLDKKITFQKGALSDIAPTILSYMGIKVPPEMTGKNLFKKEDNEKMKSNLDML